MEPSWAGGSHLVFMEDLCLSGEAIGQVNYTEAPKIVLG